MILLSTDQSCIGNLYCFECCSRVLLFTGADSLPSTHQSHSNLARLTSAPQTMHTTDCNGSITHSGHTVDDVSQNGDEFADECLPDEVLLKIDTAELKKRTRRTALAQWNPQAVALSVPGSMCPVEYGGTHIEH